jgi:hypothetical protein
MTKYSPQNLYKVLKFYEFPFRISDWLFATLNDVPHKFLEYLQVDVGTAL